MEQETYLTVSEVRQILRFKSDKTIYNAIRAGKLQATRVGRNLRITPAAVSEFTRNKTATPKRDPRNQKERIARLMRAS
ncbi:helix-turn-helix domain-containing protein [Sinomonas susongensis]|uniref:helix-turn-helix domain-containing protein n=1 Tax=Sinomonas susongensis TaxID=1324851 RepID=UPI0011088850|nr:helix-turn-helix domain-containing protein [Sinomonas susongensis]